MKLVIGSLPGYFEPVQVLRPVGQPKAALRSAGIEDFRWHDLRHTWASRHIQAGTSTAELQELGGWQSSEMVRRYAHFAAEHLAKAAARIEPPDTKMATPEKQNGA